MPGHEAKRQETMRTKPNTPPADQPAFKLSEAADLLERMLRAQLDGHQRLLKSIESKRQAIRAADIDAITAQCAQENQILQKLGEVEKRRLELTGRVTAALKPQAERPLKVSEIAEVAGEPNKTRLLAISAQLREVIGEVKKQSSIVRSAADALSRHMTGIAQTVNTALSRARVYSSRGRIAVGTQLQSMVDLKT
jgi:hypothetical protein